MTQLSLVRLAQIAAPPVEKVSEMGQFSARAALLMLSLTTAPLSAWTNAKKVENTSIK